MASSKWQNRNKETLNTGMVISFVSAGVLGIWTTLMGFGRWGSLVALSVAAGGYILTFIIASRHANVMVRVLNADYEEIEPAFRKMLFDNHIRFVFKTEADFYQYSFSGTSLVMTVEPHTLNPYHNEALDRWLENPPGVQITLGVLDARNQAFAKKLAAMIDELGTRHP